FRGARSTQFQGTRADHGLLTPFFSEVGWILKPYRPLSRKLGGSWGRNALLPDVWAGSRMLGARRPRHVVVHVARPLHPVPWTPRPVGTPSAGTPCVGTLREGAPDVKRRRPGR